MLSLHQIRTIAQFEAKILFRSWFFRILGILMLGTIFFYNLAMIVFKEGQIQQAVTSAIPYSNLMFYNVVQAIIAIFLASDFLKRDKKLDTTEVIYTRSMSNGDYVIGKLLGNLIVFTTLNLIILGLALVFNIIVGFNTISWSAYILYFFLISVPTLIFIIGLSFVLMNIIKNQAVTFAVLVGYVFLTMFYLKNQYYYLFDYMVYNIPMLYSGFIGFVNLKLLLIHRGMYTLLGLSFITFSIYKLWRLPNKPFSNVYPLLLAVVFLAGGVILGTIHVNESTKGEELRKEMVSVNNKYASYNRVSIVSQGINLKHIDKNIVAESSIKAINKTNKSIDTLIISLNPGLIISKIEVNNRDINFTRDVHLALVKLSKPLSSNDSIEINISYQGLVSDEACYIDIDEKTRKKEQDADMVNIGKVYSYVSKNFVFLTPESNWYPTSTVGFNHKNALWMLPNFSKYYLEVTTNEKLTVISQGSTSKIANKTSFHNENLLPGISIVIGEYVEKSYENQQPDIGVYHRSGVDFYSKFFSEIKDTAQGIIYKAFEDYSLKLNIKYPFNRLCLVEVPIQVTSIQRFWSNHTEMLQPELIFVPEGGGQNRIFRFERNFKNKKDWGQSRGKSDKELKVEELNSFLNSFSKKIERNSFNFRNNTLIEEEVVNPFFVFDQFYAFNHPVESEEYPIFNTLLGSYYQKKAITGKDNRYSFGFGEEEKAVLLLQKKSLNDIMLNSEYYNLADNLIMLKGDALFSLLEKRIGKAQFEEILLELFSKHKSQTIQFSEFSSLIKEKTGHDVRTLLEFWLKSDKLPGFRIGSVEAFKVSDGERQHYLTRAVIGNDGDIEGIVKIAIRETGNDESSNIEYKTFDVGLNQFKTISILTDKQPSTVIINTNASKNVPVKQEISIMKAEKNDYIKAANEEKVEPLNNWDELNEIIVDNEDSLFTVQNISAQGLLVKLANKISIPGDEYQGFLTWSVSGKWGKYINSTFYGQYLHSAVAVRSGKGESKAFWTIPIKEKGQYDIYTYIPKAKNEEDNDYLGEYHYTVITDDGVNNIMVNGNDNDGGWVLLGTYYCSPENTKVELNNKSNARVVVADAIKAVKL